jgi:hypothetical protein
MKFTSHELLPAREPGPGQTPRQLFRRLTVGENCQSNREQVMKNVTSGAEFTFILQCFLLFHECSESGLPTVSFCIRIVKILAHAGLLETKERPCPRNGQ